MAGFHLIRDLGVPKEQLKAAVVILGNLDSMEQYIRQFSSALDLYNSLVISPMAEMRNDTERANRRKHIDWKYVAARDGAMSIFHFGKTIEGTRSSFHHVPAIKEHVDHDILREAKKDFDKNFPMYIKMRHALAHAGELTSTPKSHDNNTIKGSASKAGIVFGPEAEGGMVTNSLHNHQYISTYKGEMISYMVTQQSLDFMIDAFKSFIEAFGINERDKEMLLRDIGP